MKGRRSASILAGVTVAAIAAATLLAVATIDPPPLPVKHRKPAVVAAPAAAPSLAEAAPRPRADAAPRPKTDAAPPPKAEAAPLPPPSPSSSLPEHAATADQASDSSATADQPATADLSAVALDELRTRANGREIAAMEELGRRLLQGTGTPKDPQAGAGWLLRAAKLGSAQSAFNIAVMYERGFVVERDSSKAAEWYRKAADAGLPTAKHNLALLLRDGKGTPRDVKAATALLLSAAHQGMAASMFTLGDIYEQGDGGTKDPAAALAWFAITGEFERQTNHGGDTALARSANQRAQILKRTLTTAELEHAQELAQSEFKQIVSALAPQPEPTPAQAAPPAKEVTVDWSKVDWPKTAADQVRAVQQALFDLKRLRDKPDGTLGPVTRGAIRDFQKSAGLRETGEPSRELYAALLSARNDIVTDSPLPAPPTRGSEPPASAPSASEPHRPPAETTVETAVDLGTPPPPPPPPTSIDIAAAAAPKVDLPKADPPKPPPIVVDTTRPSLATVESARPAPPGVDIPAAPSPDPQTWPDGKAAQLKAIQALLHELRFYDQTADGKAGPATTAAIRDYQRKAGMKETGEPSKALFDSLCELRKRGMPAGNAAK